MRAVGGALVFVALGVTWPAFADDPRDPARNAEAVTLGHAGLDAYHRGEWQAAFDAFDRAEQISHSPVFLLYMARSKRNLGAYLEARALYERVVGEDSTARPQTWQSSQRDAERELSELMSKLAGIVVQLQHADLGDVSVTVDGRTVTPGDEILLEPGRHLVVARHSDGSHLEQPIDAVAGERRRLLTLGFAEPAAALAERRRPHAAPRKVVPAPAAAPPTPDRTAAYVAGAIGVAGIAVGAVSGIVAWSKLRELEERCGGTACTPAERQRMEEFEQIATLADIGFLVGAAGLATAAVLLWVVPQAHAGSGARPLFGAAGRISVRLTF